ncbi:MAG TPA: hypothetical protein DEH78_32750 [Solibacterales bacterium]|nr:hypothetical protein [Bryobacterales bacterium]
MAESNGVPAASMPLGGMFEGDCRLPGEAPWRPGEALLRAGCNVGYAGGACTRFPVQADADAVRFLIEDESAGGVRVAYAFEKSYAPAGHGSITVALGHPAAPDFALTVLQAQAEAYAHCYRESKHE